MEKKKLLEELKILVFEKNKATKQNRDKLFKLAKANKDINTIEKLRDDFGFKSAKIYLAKLDNQSLDDAIKNRDFESFTKFIEVLKDKTKVNTEELIEKKYDDIFLELLITKGFYVNVAHLVKKRYKLETIKLAIKNGAKVDELYENMNALFYAIKANDLEIVKLLLELKAKVNTRFNHGLTALYLAMDNIEIVKLLLKYGADINNQISSGFTLLIKASLENNIELVKVLLDNGADINIKTANKGTALIVAIARQNVEVIKILLEHGADVNVVEITGATPLDMAKAHNNETIINLLLQKGAKSTNSAISPLFQAFVDKNIEDIERLLSLGHNIDEENERGTALMYASSIRDIEMVKLLLSYGADINKQTKRGVTALDITYEEKEKKLYKLINNGEVFIYKSNNGIERLKGRPSSLGLLMEYDEIIELLEDKYLTSSFFIDECFKTVNSTITSPFIAERFVIEELDSARGGNLEAQKWAKECGYKEYEYLDTLSKSFPEVDGGEGPQQTLTRLIFPYFVKDINNENRHVLVAYVRRKVIEKVMKYYSLGKYKDKIKRIKLINLNTIDIYNNYLIFDNNQYESLSTNKYVNPSLQTYLEIKNQVVVLSSVTYNNQDNEEEIFKIKSIEDLYLFDVRQEKKHTPKALLDILNKFSSDERLRYTNHPLDKKVNYDTFIKDLKIGFEDRCTNLEILSSTLYKSMSDLLFSKDETIQGWSSTLIKNEIEQGNLSSNLINDLQDKVKRLIVVKDEDNLNLMDRLDNIIKELDLKVEIYTDYLGENPIDKFFTDTQRFEQAIKIIFKDINENSKDSTKKVIVEANEDTISGFPMIEIRIIHIDSKSSKSSENLKKAITVNGGNFKSIYNNLLSVCDWSIDTGCSDGRYRIDYLYPQIDNNEPHSTKIDDSIRGFTHILRFYK